MPEADDKDAIQTVSPETELTKRDTSFVAETVEEVKKVEWPTGKEVQQTTIITIIAVLFFAAYLFGVDQILTLIINQITKVLS